jgi:glycine/D-amino acid oxidase-like deaminating enzyme
MSPPVNPVFSDDKLPVRADAVVIGGGIIGCAAAYFLARRGISVALIEKGRIAGEQSSRNWGWCRQQGRDKAEIPLIKESLAIWGRLQSEIGADLGFRREGIVYLTRDPAKLAGWERWMGHAREHQIGSRLLSAAEAQAMTPDCRERWIGGLHTPSDGRAEPAMAAPAIAEAARNAGASLHQGCAARGLETEAGKVAMVVTEQGAIRTNAVLLAGGAWSSIFCRRHGIDLPQLTVRASVMRTTPAPAVTEGAMGTPGFSIRRRLDGGSEALGARSGEPLRDHARARPGARYGGARQGACQSEGRLSGPCPRHHGGELGGHVRRHAGCGAGDIGRGPPAGLSYRYRLQWPWLRHRSRRRPSRRRSGLRRDPDRRPPSLPLRADDRWHQADARGRLLERDDLILSRWGFPTRGVF